MSATDHGAGTARPLVRVVAGVATDGDRVLITQRPPGGEHGLMWEFPGGKIEPGETSEQALEREIAEELGVAARSIRVLATHRHEYPSGLRVEVVFLAVELASRAFQCSAAVHATRWVVAAELDPTELLAADRPFLAALAAGATSEPNQAP